MRKTSLPCAVVLALLGLVVLLRPPVFAQGPAIGPDQDCRTYEINQVLTADHVSRPMLPPCAPNTTTKGEFKDSVDNRQHGFDLYSWLTFIALNSPADGLTPINRGADGPTIWETYKQLPEVMRDKGERPTDWGQPTPLPEACRGVASQGRMVVYVVEEAFDQPFKSGPLIDQDGNYALFMILMNKDMFEFILNKRLYSKQGQSTFDGGPIIFPIGSNRSNTAAGKVGAIMIKASWKVLGPNEKAETFHTLNGLVYIPKGDNPKSDATCVPKKLGLIGFHVGHKTEFAPQWVWTTFEHVKNAPEQRDVTLHRNLLAHYNFYDPTCDPTKCAVNATPPPPTRWDPRVQPFPGGYKSQITRVVPLIDDVIRINALSQSVAGIKGTIWENYMLVSTQWPTDFQNKIEKTGVPAPTYLANTTLETYSQGEAPISSSSCIACHLNATTASGKENVLSSDFTYILEKAR